jgi:glycosyltransferase involved in cell wall biosynthesis
VRIIHTIASTRLDHGGTSRSVPALCDALAELGADVHLVAGRPADPMVPCGWPADAGRVHAVDESARMRSWGMSGRFQRELAAVCDVHSAAIIHDHGAWLATNHAAATFARRRELPRVVSPRGMLSHWSLQRAWLKKQAAWYAYQRRDLAAASAWHATSQAEATEICDLGFRQPIAVVTNGVEFPPTVERKLEAGGVRTMLFMSRIHPKKGLIPLIDAWAAAAPGPEWRLVIAGPDEGGHRAEVERAATARGLGERVSFPGAISDADKWSRYAAADVFILPSFSENFGLVVAEALAAGTPVIATTGTPWCEVATQGCGWWVAPDVASLAAAIRMACQRPREELDAMGLRGAAWSRRKFTWRHAAEKLLVFYEQILCARSPRPPQGRGDVAAKQPVPETQSA